MFIVAFFYDTWRVSNYSKNYVLKNWFRILKYKTLIYCNEIVTF